MKVERYNRAIHRCPNTYVQQGSSNREQDVRTVLAVNGIFTELAYDFHTKVRQRNQNRLIIPTLSGDPLFIRVHPDGNSKHVHNGVSVCVGSQYQASSNLGNTNLGLEVPTKAEILPYTKALINTARALYSLIDDRVFAESLNLDYERKAFIATETFFGSYPRKTMLAGIQSIMQTIGILTYDAPLLYGGDRLALYKDLIYSGLVNDFAMSVELGWLGLASQYNYYLPQPFEDDQPLAFTANLRQILHKKRVDNRKKPTYSGKRNMGCPAAYNNTPILDHEGQPLIVQKSGIQLIAELFPPYLDYFYKDSTQLSA